MPTHCWRTWNGTTSSASDSFSSSRWSGSPWCPTARRAAAGKRYLYLLDNGPIAAPLLRRFAWHVPGALDLDALRGALAAMRGRHDFGAFCAAPGRDADPVCHLQAVHVLRRRALVA